MRKGRARVVRPWLAASILFATLACGRAARADSLTPSENERLLAGETVTRDETLERAGARYVGGVTYTIVDASPATLDRLMSDPRSYREVLPMTKRARLVGENDGDAFVELKQGNAFLETTYTIRVHREAAAHGAEFWLDRSKPHELADAWGFFRYEPTTDGRTLLTYGILVDVGGGVRSLFEERVRRAMLRVPSLVSAYVAREQRRYAAR